MTGVLSLLMGERGGSPRANRSAFVSLWGAALTVAAAEASTRVKTDANFMLALLMIMFARKGVAHLVVDLGGDEQGSRRLDS
jgi:hypothetical protein